MNVEVVLTPADYRARKPEQWTGRTCVIFDVLRATSVMVTGLASGAAGFLPVSEIAEAVAQRARYPEALLAGERNGLRITAAQSGGAEFDLGNSPREYTSACVAGRLIVSTTTNGTRALRACAGAETVAVAGFLNLAATARWLVNQNAKQVALVCAGTGEAAAIEDVLAAGALCEQLQNRIATVELDDAAQLARRSWLNAKENLMDAIRIGENGKRLLANSELCADVEICLRRDVYDFVALLDSEGIVRRVIK